MTPSDEAKETIVSLSFSNWLGMITLIVGGVVASLSLTYSLHLNGKESMADESARWQNRVESLDDKWQARIMELATIFRTELHEFDEKHPPPDLLRRIDKLEDQVEKLQGKT